LLFSKVPALWGVPLPYRTWATTPADHNIEQRAENSVRRAGHRSSHALREFRLVFGYPPYGATCSGLCAEKCVVIPPLKRQNPRQHWAVAGFCARIYSQPKGQATPIMPARSISRQDVSALFVAVTLIENPPSQPNRRVMLLG
jgi:hypothetical protein